MIEANGIKVIPTFFPDGTSQVWKIDERLMTCKHVLITWKFESESEFMHLAQLVALLDMHVDSKDLFMPYLPYARQDKEISNVSTFALHVFFNLLIELDFDDISCFDIHAKNTLIRNIPPKREVLKALIATGSDILVYPDNGASVKYSPIFNDFIDSVYAAKTRDQATGEILGMDLFGDVKGLSCLIVDDICDGGTTFTKLAKLLFDSGATEVNLYVSHGLFSKGIQVLKEANINRIFTKDGEVNQ